MPVLDPAARRAEFLAALRPNIRVATPLPEDAVFNFVDSATLLRTDFRQRWLVEHVLVENQIAVVGGPRKALKTSLIIDLGVSLATGRRFLDRFAVRRPTRVGIISGESGGATIQETFRRICEAKEIEHPHRVDLHWDFRVPRLSDPDHLAGLSEAIQTQRLKVVILDPLYLMLLNGNANAQPASIYTMGPLLADLAKACQDAGATPVLVHHFKQAATAYRGVKTYAAPELDDLSYAGVQEFARQWLLLGRRAKYEPGSGRHELWLSVGGSAGHSDCWALDIEEGQLNSNFGGRRWDVHVRSVADELRRQAQQNERDKEEQAAAKDAEDRAKILEAVRGAPSGVTINELESLANISKRRLPRIVRELVRAGHLMDCEVEKCAGRSVRTYSGVRIRLPVADDEDEAGEDAEDRGADDDSDE